MNEQCRPFELALPSGANTLVYEGRSLVNENVDLDFLTWEILPFLYGLENVVFVPSLKSNRLKHPFF